MHYVSFLFHILPLLVSITSIVTSIIVYKQKILTKEKWYYYYIHMLISVSLFPVVFTIFSILLNFTVFSTKQLTILYICAVFPALCYLLNTLFNIITTTVSFSNILILRRIFYIYLSLLVIYFMLLLIFNVDFLLTSIHIAAGILFAYIYLLQLSKIKELVRDESKNIYTINSILSMVMMLALVIYYVISDSRNTASLKFPVISIFCLSMHLLNILYNIKYINKRFSESANDENTIVSADDLRQFVNKFGISKRESQVLLLFAQKMQRVQISEELGIAKRTTDKHIENIYKKCHVSSSVSLFELIKSNM